MNGAFIFVSFVLAYHASLHSTHALHALLHRSYRITAIPALPPRGTKIGRPRAGETPSPNSALPETAISSYRAWRSNKVLDFEDGAWHTGCMMGAESLEGFHDLPGLLGPGIYALLWNDEVLYIGKAARLLKRVCEHREAWERFREGKGRSQKAILFNRVAIRPVRYESDLDRLEKEFIRKLQPKHNVRLKKDDGKVSLEAAGFDFSALLPPVELLDRRL